MSTSFLRSQPSRPVAAWLLGVAVLVFAMVVVGGATRLTGSGLSITDWRPLTGAVPPLSQAAWAEEFAGYKEIPQYTRVNRGMTLEEFKAIYWWEWSHRLLGRIVGVAFALPLLVFLALKMIPRPLIWRCWVLLGLGGLQGFVGWWMVSSGLQVRIDVAPERLATHLGLALILLAALIWTGLEAWAGESRPVEDRWWARTAAALGVAVFAQIILGAFVAGNDAGFVYNDWPLMNGRVLPADYLDGSLLHSLAHSKAAVQLHHRLGAYLLFAGAWAAAFGAWRSHRLDAATKAAAALVAIMITLQAALGIVTLIHVTPLPLAILHQGFAALVLAAAVGFAWKAGRP